MRIVAGRFKGQILKAPKGDATRPTSSQLREALFNICRNHLEGCRFLDLFCGSGAIGFEAISRGASSVYLVDRHPLAIQAVKENMTKLNIAVKVLKSDVMQSLEKLQKENAQFDIIFVDPPYQAEPKKIAPRTSEASKILAFIDNSMLLASDGLLFIEEGGQFERLGPLTNLIESTPRTFGKSILYQFTKTTSP